MPQTATRPSARTDPTAHAGPPSKSMDLYVSNRCNEKCIFCLTSVAMRRLRKRTFDLERLSVLLTTLAARGWNHINLTGGEPLLYRNLEAFLILARKIGYKIQLSTNGTPFADSPPLAQRVLPLLDYVCLAVHGHTADLHDWHTGVPSSFQRLRKTISLFTSVKRVSFNTNTVLTSFNIEHVTDIVRFILDQGVFSHIVLSYPCPVGEAKERYGDISFGMQQFVAKIPEVLTLFSGTDVQVSFFGFPLCILGEFRRYSNDLTYEKRRLSAFCSEKTGRFSLARDIQHAVFTKPEACSECLLRSTCQGVFAAYLAWHGNTELRPIRQ